MWINFGWRRKITHRLCSGFIKWSWRKRKCWCRMTFTVCWIWSHQRCECGFFTIYGIWPCNSSAHWVRWTARPKFKQFIATVISGWFSLLLNGCRMLTTKCRTWGGSWFILLEHFFVSAWRNRFETIDTCFDICHHFIGIGCDESRFLCSCCCGKRVLCWLKLLRLLCNNTSTQHWIH